MAANVTIGLLPLRAINHPEIGSDTNNPTGKENSTSPNSVSESMSFCWIAGMREAQLEKQKPNKKNMADTAMRCCRLL